MLDMGFLSSVVARKAPSEQLITHSGTGVHVQCMQTRIAILSPVV